MQVRLHTVKPAHPTTGPPRPYSITWLTTLPEPDLLNHMVEQVDRLSRVFAALGDPTRRDLVARLASEGCDGGRLGGAVRRVPPGGLQAPQGARGRRPGQPQPRRPATTGPSGGGGVRPDDEMDPALPAGGGGALPAPRRLLDRMDTTKTTTSRSRTKEQQDDHDDDPPETTIEADPDLPTVRIVREFDAPSSASAAPTSTRSW